MADCTFCKTKNTLYITLDRNRVNFDEVIDTYMDGMILALEISEIQAEQLLTIAYNRGECYIAEGSKEYIDGLYAILHDEYNISCRIEGKLLK